jgi:leucyl aminopeptidase
VSAADPRAAEPTAEPTAGPTAPTDVLLDTGSAATAAADAVVVGLLPATGGAAPVLAAGADEVAAAFDGELPALLALAGAGGKADEVVKVPTRGALTAPLLVAVGLGKPEGGSGDGGPTPEQVRRAAGAAARALAGTGHAVSALGHLDLAAAVEGTLLGAYTFREYRSNGEGKPPLGRVTFLFDVVDNVQEEQLRRAAAVARAVRTARDLVNTPPNDLFPESFAARAAALAGAAGVQVEVLDEAALAEGGFGGVLGVGQGSARKPRLVRLSYAGGASPRAKVALVGKGITFDTGGISIKPAAGMDHMTSDMSGAAAVIATTVLAAQLELPVAVTATVPMAENMPSDTAYRPGDVLRMYGGKTVEVLNTDAEGRLILADAIVRAAEDSPDYLVETSTLTGAQQVALGMRTAGVMGSDEFRDRVAGHARATGEDGWAMPLPPHMRAELDSRLADIANVTGSRWGGMLVAGTFLREFVPDGLPWAHIDIAGPAFHAGGPYGYTVKGGTGVPVRTLFALLSDIAENG